MVIVLIRNRNIAAVYYPCHRGSPSLLSIFAVAVAGVLVFGGHRLLMVCPSDEAKKSSKIPLQAFKGGAPFCLLSAYVPPAALPQRVASGWANPSWRGPSQGLSMSACRWSVPSKRPPLGGVGRDFCVVALLRLPL